MVRTHDMGGRPGAGPVSPTEHQLADWELLADAVNQALNARGIRRTDELRRAVEDLPPDAYQSLSYYERWVAGLEQLLEEKGLLTRDEIDSRVAHLEHQWGEP